nr:MAG TPA: hypothetical protein [Caudoviricetes sp.]
MRLTTIQRRLTSRLIWFIDVRLQVCFMGYICMN